MKDQSRQPPGSMGSPASVMGGASGMGGAPSQQSVMGGSSGAGGQASNPLSSAISGMQAAMPAQNTAMGNPFMQNYLQSAQQPASVMGGSSGAGGMGYQPSVMGASSGGGGMGYNGPGGSAGWGAGAVAPGGSPGTVNPDIQAQMTRLAQQNAGGFGFGTPTPPYKPPPVQGVNTGMYTTKPMQAGGPPTYNPPTTGGPGELPPVRPTWGGGAGHLTTQPLSPGMTNYGGNNSVLAQLLRGQMKK